MTPDAFHGDPYGELTNQISHVALGHVLSVSLCIAYLWSAGELPYRVYIIAIVGLIYAAIEMLQGWRGWDTVMDTYATIGGACVLIPLTEIRMPDVWYKPQIEVNLLWLVGVFVAVAIPIWARVAQRDRQSREM